MPFETAGSLVNELRAERFSFAPADMHRVAAYLQTPSPDAIDEVTFSFIKECEAECDALLDFWVKARVFPISKITGNRIELEGGRALEATKAYCRQLEQTEADWLALTSFTIGRKVDERVSQYLSEDDVFKGFVLNQWASVMTEQARAWVTHSLCSWADSKGRTLIPYSGPGYNGWNLSGLRELQDLLSDTGDEPRIKITEAGMMTPVNSMMIVYAASMKASVLSVGDSLAQCARCGMKNCAFRATPLESMEAAEVVGLAH